MGNVLCAEFCLTGPAGGAVGDRLSPIQLRALLQRSNCPIHLFNDVRSIGVGGGTSDFFVLVPADGAITPQGVVLDGHSWIGKDLEGDYEELRFYDLARHLAAKPEWALLEHMIPFAGIVLGEDQEQDHKFPALSDDESSDALLDSEGRPAADVETPAPLSHVQDALSGRTLLVLADLLEDLVEPRLLDLKIGARTAQANWKGKSSFASWRNGIVDNCTNSAIEGVRLEGFLGAPPSIELEDPASVLGGGFAGSKFKKKAKKVALQRMSMASTFLAFSDFRSSSGLPASSDDPWLNNGLTDGDSVLSSSEYAELAMLVVTKRMADIVRKSRLVPVPQKWIGTSVCITADAGAAPPRANGTKSAQAWVEERVRVHIFDWARAELNTPDQHEKFTEEQQEDREEFWGLYNVGIGRLLWESARYYWHNCCAEDWTFIEFFVYDRNYASKDSFIGSAQLDLESTKCNNSNNTTAPSQLAKRDVTLLLKSNKGRTVVGANGKQTELKVSLAFDSFPRPSRLRGAWRVRVESASSLPVCDIVGSSDAFVLVAMSQLGPKRKTPSGKEIEPKVVRRAQRLTRVIEKSLHPKWEEEFEFPVVFSYANADHAGESCFRQGLGIGDIDYHPVLQQLGLDSALQEALPPHDELGNKVAHGDDLEFRFLGLFIDGCELDMKHDKDEGKPAATSATSSDDER
eukprot:TRINITY_DN21746_c0_g1_i1.p1 TRINITY_DN21746_c0_g1~~TRINITY_DN21746_c0_g1_i1.p1  ORF type:complete len:704 (+),score=102.15 TRINITY_DN21746_c0_g1_i1:46-2112(+)